MCQALKNVADGKAVKLLQIQSNVDLYIITVIFGSGLTKAGLSTQLRTVKIQTK